ncbi:MAG: type II toxin-antitoxin system RelE/ParE family toxin [Chthoniobacterales bacterium]|nr:type II toxin-antitoxin system RelE/ParE family toxin [Chthoniobacterales bacterium]
MVFRIIVSPGARRDLRGIQRYISIDSPQAALRFGQRLLKKQEMLGSHPEIGRVVLEIGNRAVRELIVGNYRLIYEVNFLNKEIEIFRYWHAARGIPKVT